MCVFYFLTNKFSLFFSHFSIDFVKAEEMAEGTELLDGEEVIMEGLSSIADGNEDLQVILILCDFFFRKLSNLFTANKVVKTATDLWKSVNISKPTDRNIM